MKLDICVPDGAWAERGKGKEAYNSERGRQTVASKALAMPRSGVRTYVVRICTCRPYQARAGICRKCHGPPIMKETDPGIEHRGRTERGRFQDGKASESDSASVRRFAPWVRPHTHVGVGSVYEYGSQREGNQRELRPESGSVSTCRSSSADPSAASRWRRLASKAFGL